MTEKKNNSTHELDETQTANVESKLLSEGRKRRKRRYSAGW